MFSFFSSKQEYKRPYKIGLALSGGGARGFAHIGVLRALEEYGIKPDIIAGVSAGSVVAAYYAAGFSPEEMFSIYSHVKASDILSLTVPSNGIFKFTGLCEFLKSTLKVEKIEDLKIPTVIGASNLDTFQFTEFTSGSLAERIVASCSIPVLIQPAVIDGIHYIDGGVLHNLPASSLRDKCDILIGIDVSTIDRSTYKSNLADTAYKAYRLMAHHNAKPDINLCDIVVQLDEIAGTKEFDLNDVEDIVKKGYFKAKKVFTNSEIIQQVSNEFTK